VRASWLHRRAHVARLFVFPVLVISLWTAIGAASFLYGGALWAHWLPCLAILLLASAAIVGSGPADTQPRLGRLPAAALGALVAVSAWQLFPQPRALLQVISGAGASLQEAVVSFVPSRPALITLLPPDSLRWALTLAGLVAVFLAAHVTLRRAPERCWLAAVPLLVLGGLQAALGLAQVYLASQPLATGTYVNRNHYAGLLEMALPFAVMGGVAVLKGRRRARRLTVRRALAASALFALGALMLAAIIHSLSRGGFSFALVSLAVMGGVALAGPGGAYGWKRRGAVGVIGAAAAAAFLFLPTDPLIYRFGALAATEEISADVRVQIWEDTVELVRDYPLAGVGLGGYTAAIHRYQTAAPMRTIGMAHNDYLQLAAELGLPAFAVLLLLAGWTVLSAIRASSSPAPKRRYLGLGCLGALAALALHSLVDFNLYLPANAAVLAWIAGLATALPSLPKPLLNNSSSRLPVPPLVLNAEPLPPR